MKFGALGRAIASTYRDVLRHHALQVAAALTEWSL